MNGFNITTFGNVLRKRMGMLRQKPDNTAHQSAIINSDATSETKEDATSALSKQSASKTICQKKTPKPIKAKNDAEKLYGVYIQDVNGGFWKAKDWDSSVEPNAIALINDSCKFRIALDGIDKMQIHDCNNAVFEDVLMSYYGKEDAMLDYDGAFNTEKLLTRLPNYAVGYCNSYVFPDGVTHGYLPSLGELHRAYLNKKEIGTALNACGGRLLAEKFHWSSTIHGKAFDCESRSLWVMSWGDDYADWLTPSCMVAVRPFAPL